MPVRYNRSMRDVQFEGSAEKDIGKFPAAVRDRLFTQLAFVQEDMYPLDYKPMPSIGPGVMEIRVRDRGNAYRAVYVAKYGNLVHVLHAFQKKTQKTPQPDLELARKRHSEVQQRYR